MKEDRLLTAVERVAVGHGLPHPAKTGLGLSYDQIGDLQNLIDVAIDEFKAQLIDKLKAKKADVIPGDDFSSGQRVAYSSAIFTVMNAEYH